jgi:DNA-binding PadR family transcriptional regulator
MSSLELQKKLPKWETEFKRGLSKPFELLSLTKEPHYPYQIIRTLSGLTQGKFAIAGSNIYPLLQTLTEEGFIRSQKDEETSKKYYSLTEEGLEFLSMLETSLLEFSGMVHDLVETQGVMKENGKQ